MQKAGAHEIGAAISGPRIAGEKFYEREAFSDDRSPQDQLCKKIGEGFYVKLKIYGQLLKSISTTTV